MTADEFIALVERHPLPWHMLGDADGSVDYWRPGHMPLANYDGAGTLADAAPALAAAAIRLLRERARIEAESGLYLDSDQIESLRSALPPELRP